MHNSWRIEKYITGWSVPMYKTLLRLIKISSNYTLWMILAALVGFLTVGSGVGLLMTSAYIIAKAALPVTIASIQIGIVGVRFFGISKGVFRYLERLISHEVTFRLLANFRVWFFKRLEPLVPARTASRKSGDLLSRFVTDVEELQNIFLRILAPPLVALFTLILMWFLFGIYDIKFSMVFLGFYLTAAIIIPYMSYKVSYHSGIEIVKVRAELKVKSVELVQGMSELAVYDTGNKHIRETSELNSRLTSLQQKVFFVNGLAESLVGLFMNGAVLSLLYFGIKAVSAGSMQGLFLPVIVIGVMASFEALLPLPAAFQNLSNSTKAASRLFQIIDSRILHEKGSKPRSIDSWDIELKDIYFSYKDTLVLKDISLNIPGGKRIAIAGPSGSGKTTIVNLLLGFWQPDEGHILIGGKDISKLDPAYIRGKLSVMSQDCFLFNRTIKENLTLADSRAGRDKISRAIARSNFSEKLDLLPENLETHVGEHGLLFSGGERQRLCLARTFLKDSPVYIFDEPGTNLDSINERAVYDSIFSLGSDRTVLLITHKLKYLKQADYIYYIEDGTLKEKGTFDELIEKGGRFGSVFELQDQIIDLP